LEVVSLRIVLDRAKKLRQVVIQIIAENVMIFADKLFSLPFRSDVSRSLQIRLIIRIVRTLLPVTSYTNIGRSIGVLFRKRR
jgi:hypothetical protein